MHSDAVIPLISVVLPVFNGASTIGCAVESILGQSFSNFELLIGDDGSTDETQSILQKYTDERIKIIKLHKDFTNTLNTLLSLSKGRYIARIDADDYMLPERLRIQYDYMESHPDVAVTGGLADNIDHPEWFASGGEVSLSMLCEGNRILNPTTMIRASVLHESGCSYQKNYEYAEDFQFWSALLRKGYKIVNLPIPLIFYGLSPQQVSNRKKNEMSKLSELIIKENIEWLISQSNQLYAPVQIESSENLLSVIIPFLNEGIEIVNTVRSIREMWGNEVDIIAINDGSYDGVNYQEELSQFNVFYCLNRTRLGVAASRELGISMIATPYFLLLDGHMRVVGNTTHKAICSMLKEDDRRILCCQSVPLINSNDGDYIPDELAQRNYGAFMPKHRGRFLPDIGWINEELYPQEDTEPIPFILGAAYAASKRYWNYLGGLRGLKCYGCDEAYISLKSWMAGGECRLLKKHIVGHMYRKRSPYVTYNSEVLYNALLISELIFPPRLLNWSYAMSMASNFSTYMKALGLLKSNGELLSELRDKLNEITCFSYKEIETKFSTLLERRISNNNIVWTNFSDSCALMRAWVECYNLWRCNSEVTDTDIIIETDSLVAERILAGDYHLNRFDDDLGMILAYTIARVEVNDRIPNVVSPLVKIEMLSQIIQIAKKVLITVGCDIRNYFHAREFLYAMNESNEYIWEPSVNDILDVEFID